MICVSFGHIFNLSLNPCERWLTWIYSFRTEINNKIHISDYTFWGVWARFWLVFTVLTSIDQYRYWYRYWKKDDTEYRYWNPVDTGSPSSNLGLPTYTLLTDLISPKKVTEVDLDDLVKTLSSHFRPAPKALSERYKFGQRTQQPGETVNTYVADLRRLASTCKFTCCLEERLRDQVILGLSNAQCQRVLFTKEDDVTLDKVIGIATAQELAVSRTAAIREFSSSTPEQVHKATTVGGGRQKGPGSRGPKSGQQSRTQGQSGHNDSRKSCGNCGLSHSQGQCPARKKECHSCGKKGHFS